jgi:rubrerythrin
MKESSQVRRVFEYALAREQQGIAFFQENAGRLNHPAAQGVFKQLVEEERKHAQFIQGLLDQLADTGKVTLSDALSEEVDLFSNRADLEQLDQTVYESMVPDVTVLRMAYLIERDFAEFYTRAAEKATGEVKSALERLAAWEEGHERLFKHLHDTLFDAYMEMPWGG